MYTRIGVHFKHEKVHRGGLAVVCAVHCVCGRRQEHLHGHERHRLQPVVRRRHHVLLDGLRRAHLYDMRSHRVMRCRCENRLHSNVQHRVPRRVHRGLDLVGFGGRAMLAEDSLLVSRG